MSTSTVDWSLCNSVVAETPQRCGLIIGLCPHLCVPKSIQVWTFCNSVCCNLSTEEENIRDSRHAYRVSGSTLTAVERSQLLARWPGTLCRILSGIQQAAQTVLDVYLKRTCQRDTSASSTGVLYDYALYISTHSLTQTSSLSD